MKEITEKECKDCGLTKPVESFYKAETKDGYTKRCRKCQGIYARSRPGYRQHLARRKEHEKELRKQPITHEYVRSILDYDKETGVFTWKERDKPFKLAGQVAGAAMKRPNHNTDYWQIKILYRSIYAHRLAIFWVTGEWPEQVDHINGDGLDNRWVNLRDVSGTVNQQNIPLRKRNETGIHGVRWDGKRGYFQVTIGVKGGTKSLGTTPDFFEACCRRKSAENQLGYHQNHGRSS